MSISTSSFEKRQIADLAARISARRFLEIGAFKGKTTAVLSKAAGADGLVVAVDPMRWASRPCHIWEWIDGLLHPLPFERAFWGNVKRSGHDNVWLIRELSTNATVIADPDPRLVEFDMVFIDGEHTYDAVTADIRNWGRRVRAGGLLLLHDCINRFPGVRRAVTEMRDNPRYRVSLPDQGSIAVIEVLHNS